MRFELVVGTSKTILVSAHADEPSSGTCFMVPDKLFSAFSLAVDSIKEYSSARSEFF